MKLGLTLVNYNRMLKTLADLDFVVKEDFKGDLIRKGAEMRERAKEVLSEQSSQRTNKRFWTGRLSESIKSTVTEKEGRIIGVSIGPDMRQAPYAEWVEIGHYTVGGSFGRGRGAWWEGYHYMERAYTEIAPSIASEITKTLKVTLKKFDQGTRTRHKGTGRFVSGFSIQG